MTIGILAILVTLGLAFVGAVYRLGSTVSELRTEVRHLSAALGPLSADIARAHQDITDHVTEDRSAHAAHGERLARLEALTS